MGLYLGWTEGTREAGSLFIPFLASPLPKIASGSRVQARPGGRRGWDGHRKAKGWLGRSWSFLASAVPPLAPDGRNKEAAVRRGGEERGGENCGKQTKGERAPASTSRPEASRRVHSHPTLCPPACCRVLIYRINLIQPPLFPTPCLLPSSKDAGNDRGHGFLAHKGAVCPRHAPAWPEAAGRKRRRRRC